MHVERKWILICIIGGILMIMGTGSGLQIVRTLIGLYLTYGEPYLVVSIGQDWTSILNIFLTGIVFIMAGGGISVIIGAILVYPAHLHRIGKIIMGLGSGMGIIGLIIFITWELSLADTVNSGLEVVIFILTLFIDLYFIGVIFTIVGRRKLKKISEEEYQKMQYEKGVEKARKEKEKRVTNEGGTKCPVCNYMNIISDSYCAKCGTSLTDPLETTWNY